MNDMSASEVIALLGLVPHPEGGHYIETFRDPRSDPDGRSVSTAIYFLLAAGEVSHWHRIDSAEVWHWYAGSQLRLAIAAPREEPVIHVLGGTLATGARPQVVVPAGAWQSARSLGAWTLVGCTVAPGFAFSAFELAPDGFEPPG